MYTSILKIYTLDQNYERGALKKYFLGCPKRYNKIKEFEEFQYYFCFLCAPSEALTFHSSFLIKNCAKIFEFLILDNKWKYRNLGLFTQNCITICILVSNKWGKKYFSFNFLFSYLMAINLCNARTDRLTDRKVDRHCKKS